MNNSLSEIRKAGETILELLNKYYEVLPEEVLTEAASIIEAELQDRYYRNNPDELEIEMDKANSNL